MRLIVGRRKSQQNTQACTEADECQHCMWQSFGLFLQLIKPKMAQLGDKIVFK